MIKTYYGVDYLSNSGLYTVNTICAEPNKINIIA